MAYVCMLIRCHTEKAWLTQARTSPHPHPPLYACVKPPGPVAAMDSCFTLVEPRQHSMAWQTTPGNRIKWLWILSPTPTRKLATAACDCNLLHKTLESLLKLIKRKKVFSSRSSFFCLKSPSIALTRKRNPDMSLVKVSPRGVAFTGKPQYP